MRWQRRPAFVAALEFFVPDLVPAPSDPALPRRCPSLHRWLSRARLARAPAAAFDAVLCQRFGVTRQHDWPVAALTLLADGEAPGAACWLRADPVTVQATRADLVLAAAQGAALARDETEALLAALNRHFAPEGLRFHSPHPERWYLQTEAPAAIETVPLHQAIGRSIATLLPRGTDALSWHRRLNEIQMLLHDHPVNAAREARDVAPVNALWLWGGGRLSRCEAGGAITIWGGTPLVRGLAACAGRPCHALPADGRAWLQVAADGAHLISLDAGTPGLPSAERWHALERDWFEPLTGAVRAGALASAKVITHCGDERLTFTLSQVNLWKLWRNALPVPARRAAVADA